MAPNPKTKPKKPPDKRPQSERFKEAARTIEADESGKKFDEAFAKIVPKRPAKD
jgi:hypothetical protein